MGRISSGSQPAPQGGGRIAQAAQGQPINFIQQYEQQQKVRQVQDVFANPTKYSASQQYQAATDAERLGLIDRQTRIKTFDAINAGEVNRIKEVNKAPAWQQAIVDVTSGIGQALAAPYVRLGQGYGEVLGQITGVSDAERRAQQQSQQFSQSVIDALNKKIASPSTSALEKERYRQAIVKIGAASGQQAQQFAQQQAQIAERTNVPKALGALGQVGLDVLTAGTAGPALKGLKGLTTAQKALQIGRVAGAGAALGAGYGATSTLQEQGLGATPEDYLKSIGTGAALGAAFGLALPPLAEIANRALRKAGTTIQEIATRIGTKQPAAEAGRLTGAVERAATPTRIPVTATETPATVFQRTSDAAYARELASISKAYDAEIKKIGKMTNPAAQQAAARQLETKYESLVTKLTDNYTAGKLTPVIPPERAVPGVTPTPAVTTVPAPTPVARAVKAPVTYAPGVGEPRISGGAIKAQQRAIESKLNAQLGDLATYQGISFKEEARLASELMQMNRQEAINIALGKSPARNDAQRAALAAALEQEAMKTGDIQLLQNLASSSRFTKVSQAAQTLSAEGFFVDPTSPAAIIGDIIRTRAKVVEGRTRQTTNKLVTKEKQAIERSIKAPTKDEWASFVEGLRC